MLTDIHQLRVILEKPEYWTQGVVARIRDGKPCGAVVPEAYSWCLMGAVTKVTYNSKSPKQREERRRYLVESLAKHLDPAESVCVVDNETGRLVVFNENSTYEQVRDLVQKAFETERG